MKAGATNTETGIVNAMSVDVEDYFQVSAFDEIVSRAEWDTHQSRVVGNTDRLLALFAEFEVRASFFVLGWVAERHPALVRRIAAAGHEVASHGYAHDLVYNLTPERFRADVRRARRLLEDVGGAAVEGYRAPTFSITRQSLWALDVLAEEGYRYDASIFPVHHDRYGIPAAPRHPYQIVTKGGVLTEVPPSTVAWSGLNLPVAGGGYFRLLPYVWTHWGIARVNRTEQRPIVFYLHPWEVDPDQPRLPAAGLSRFRHYRNLHRTERRLRSLLGDFAFGPVRDLLDGAAPLSSLSMDALAAGHA